MTSLRTKLKLLFRAVAATAVLCLMLLQLAQIQGLPVCCAKPMAANPAAACCHSDCCVAHPSSNSRSAPAVPTQPNVQGEISFLAPDAVAWTLPENGAAAFPSVCSRPLALTTARLYARDCALLL